MSNRFICLYLFISPSRHNLNFSDPFSTAAVPSNPFYDDYFYATPLPHSLLLPPLTDSRPTKTFAGCYQKCLRLLCPRERGEVEARWGSLSCCGATAGVVEGNCCPQHFPSLAQWKRIFGLLLHVRRWPARRTFFLAGLLRATP